MKYSEQQLAILSAQQRNILAITSVCNMNCVFCSHLGNPDQVQTFSAGHRSLEDIKELIQFLDKNKKIVIGESITRICEGEPFIHPKIIDILKLIRNQFPETLIQITTNGSLLTSEIISLLHNLKSIEINLSLNSASLAGREKLMNDYQGEQVIDNIKDLKELNINYHGSIVAMPHIMGWDDLEKTINYLDQHGAKTIRVFLPGYTKYSPDNLKFRFELWKELEDFILKCKKKYTVPITLEPAKLEDLNPIVTGVIKNSSADKSGIEQEDRIISINKKQVISRVDAFNKLIENANPKIKLQRQNKIKTLTINKEKGEKSGLVFNYDLAPELLQKINYKLKNYSKRKVLLLTSQLAKEVLRKGLELMNNPNWQLLAVENKFFGGSILCAGLLTISDFRKKLSGIKDNLSEFDLILLPGIAFDNWGYDLIGEKYDKLEEEFGIEVDIIR